MRYLMAFLKSRAGSAAEGREPDDRYLAGVVSRNRRKRMRVRKVI